MRTSTKNAPTVFSFANYNAKGKTAKIAQPIMSFNGSTSNCYLPFTERQKNVAQGKPARQSSWLGPDYDATKATDGSYWNRMQTNPNKGFTPQWWRVDLEWRHFISTAKIYMPPEKSKSASCNNLPISVTT